MSSDTRGHFKNLDWSAYQVGLAIGTAGGIVPASRILNTSPQTVRRRLDRIESLLGVKLFERLTSGFVATPAGEVFLEAATEIERVWASFDGRIKSLAPGGGRSLVIASGTASVTLEMLREQLGLFRQHHPDIQLEMVTSDSVADLTLREADLAIRPDGCANQTADLFRRRFCDLAFAIYGSMDYLKKHGTPGSLEDISHHDLIVHNRERLFCFEPLNWAIEQCLPRSVPMVTNCFRSMMDAVAQDVGLAVLPCFLADRHPRLVRVVGGYSEMVQPLFIYMHREVRKNPEVRQFIQFFTRWAKRNSAALLGERDGTVPVTN